MFGDRLRIVRKERNLKQSDLATKLNVSPSTIGMYEQGRRDPDTETVKFLANYFNVSTDWLLGVSNIRNPYECKDDISIVTYQNLNESILCKEDMEKIKEYIEFLKQKTSSQKSKK